MNGRVIARKFKDPDYHVTRLRVEAIQTLNVVSVTEIEMGTVDTINLIKALCSVVGKDAKKCLRQYCL